MEMPYICCEPVSWGVWPTPSEVLPSELQNLDGYWRLCSLCKARSHKQGIQIGVREGPFLYGNEVRVIQGKLLFSLLAPCDGAKSR